MKKILLTLIALCTLYSCNDVKKADEAAPTPTKKGKVIKINQDQFMTLVADYTASEWKYLGDKPAIVDFYATWCGPCKIIEPYLDELAAKYADQVIFYRIDIDAEPEPAMKYKVTSIPALMFIPMKGDKKMVVGALPMERYDNLIQTVLLAE